MELRTQSTELEMLKKIVLLPAFALLLASCALFRHPEQGIVVRERAGICFRLSSESAHVLASVTPDDCYSMRCTVPYQMSGTTVLDQRAFRLDFETTFKLSESRPFLVGCGRDCSGGGVLEFDLGMLEVGLYRVFLWDRYLGDLSVTSGLPWRDQCLPAAATVEGTGESLPDEAAAQRVLVDFFERLHAGEYTAAADLYGGSYDVMLGHNPEFDPADHAGMLEAACTINGAQCLVVAAVESLGSELAGEFTFEVQFANEDGSLFTLGPCCGETQGTAQSKFIFHVRKTAEFVFHVMEPPIYEP